jgi:ornithine cyclodeaminase/alanine dehydrogenase-like protein (mu-crystallin family)
MVRRQAGRVHAVKIAGTVRMGHAANELTEGRTTMTRGDSIGFGIIGTGVIADFHARAIAAANGAHLAGVASRTAEGARSFAAKHGSPFVARDVDELLARPDVNAVCITTPSALHREPALAEAARCDRRRGR